METSEQVYRRLRADADMPFERKTPKGVTRPEEVKPLCEGHFFAVPFASHVQWGFEHEADARAFDELVAQKSSA